EWMARNAAALHDTAVVPSAVAAPADDPWLRWTRDSRHLNAIIDADGEVMLRLAVDAVDLMSARTLWGRSVELDGRDGGARVVVPKGELSPHVVRFDFRGDRATS
ncbi:MAG TPA: hypothetical protein VFN80_03480, partial [Acidothermaceae bacterium]|nr:hypothetical protein [Acidothermaceae bacterium]